MRVKIYYKDEYKLYDESPNLDYIDVYRQLDSERDVCWVHILEQEKLSYEDVKLLNDNSNIKAWEVVRN
ncbi:MAG: hypothetical protein H7263_00785 [Candidatus Sericytochromatia bacterium]|nr:hypothetical protein [Candidatus Sericytochromatia bacterium]